MVNPKLTKSLLVELVVTHFIDYSSFLTLSLSLFRLPSSFSSGCRDDKQNDVTNVISLTNVYVIFSVCDFFPFISLFLSLSLSRSSSSKSHRYRELNVTQKQNIRIDFPRMVMKEERRKSRM